MPNQRSRILERIAMAVNDAYDHSRIRQSLLRESITARIGASVEGSAWLCGDTINREHIVEHHS